MNHPIWGHHDASAIVVPTHAASMTTGIFKEALDAFPGLQVICDREYRYHRLKAGNPLYVTRGAIRDMTPFNAIEEAQGRKPNPPDIILFPIRSAAPIPQMLDDIRSGMECMTDEWFYAPNRAGSVAFPSLLESSYHRDMEAEKQLFDEILGDDPRFVWIGDGYGKSF